MHKDTGNIQLQAMIRNTEAIITLGSNKNVESFSVTTETYPLKISCHCEFSSYSLCKD